MTKIALLVAREGPAGIWAPSGEACAILAVAEINAAGGLLGQSVDLIVADAGATAATAAEAAAAVIEVDGADAVVAMLPSFARYPVSRALRGRAPYVYTPQFEGHESDPDVLTVGETADELLRPGIAWLTERKAASRYYLVGNDYIWPRVTFAAARGIIREMGGQVVGERLLPFGFTDYDQIFQEIRQARPDVVMPYLLGYEAMGFNRAFAEAGLARHMLRFTSAIDETILYALGANCTENLFVTSAYFSSLRSHNNAAFLERYHSLFGDTPPPSNGFGQSCYEGIHCLAGLVSATGALRPRDLRGRIGRAVQGRTARGFENLTVAGISRPIHLATADGHEFEMIEQR
ncbi:MAG TPA: substrate-binding domain-containing protein [Stellaceae bacterium]|nr:substrate-binding domain-containing protein [Stellaceae bacterium]